MGNAFRRKGQKASKGDDGDGIESKDDILVDIGKVNSHAHWHKDQEGIHPGMEKNGFTIC